MLERSVLIPVDHPQAASREIIGGEVHLEHHREMVGFQSKLHNLLHKLPSPIEIEQEYIDNGKRVLRGFVGTSQQSCGVCRDRRRMMRKDYTDLLTIIATLRYSGSMV